MANGAIHSGYKVIYREAHIFFEDIFEATQLKRRKKVNKLFSETDLLIIDDLFLRKKMPEQAPDDFLDIIYLPLYARYAISWISSVRAKSILSHGNFRMMGAFALSAVLVVISEKSTSQLLSATLQL